MPRKVVSMSASLVRYFAIKLVVFKAAAYDLTFTASVVSGLIAPSVVRVSATSLSGLDQVDNPTRLQDDLCYDEPGLG